MSDNSESCEREIRLRWDERTELVATLFGDVALVDEVVLTKTDLVTGQQDSLRLSAPMTFEITGLIRATEQHVLVGIRNSAICVDVVMLIETSRIRENSHGAPADEDAVGEETLARGAFAFDHERRLLFMLCGYYDQAAFYCYKVSANYRTWTRKNRREVCDYCPRGQSDLVSPAGICVLPESGNVAAIFLLEQIIIPIAEDQEPPRQGRLCWVAEFSNRADVWVEIVQPFSDDFIGNNTVIKMADRTFIEQGSAEFWQPTPVAIDSGRVAFVTHSGKVLLTEITTGSTSCLQQLHAKHASLSFDSSTNELVAILDDDQTTRIPVPSLGYSNLTTFVGSRTVVRPRKPKSHRPPRLPEPPRQPICWSVGKPLALSTNGSIAVAGRYVIDLVRNRTLCVLPDFGEKIRKVAVTPNGSRVVTNDGIVRILDGRSGQLIAETTSAREFDINPCGQCLALVDFANLSVWNLESGQLMRESPHGGNHISWSPDGRRIAFGGWTGGIVPKPDGRPGLQSVDCNRLTIWDFENWQAITEFSPGDIGFIKWTSDGLVIGSEGTIQVWNVDSQEKQLSIPVEESYGWVASPDGRHLAMSQVETWNEIRSDLEIYREPNRLAVRVFELPLGLCVTEIRDLRPNDIVISQAVSIAMSAIGTILVNSHRLQLFDIATGKLLSEPGPEYGNVLYQALSTNGRWLVTRAWERSRVGRLDGDVHDRKPASFDETIRVLDLSPLELPPTMAPTNEPSRSDSEYIPKCVATTPKAERTPNLFAGQVTISNDGEHVAYVDETGLRLYKTTTETSHCAVSILPSSDTTEMRNVTNTAPLSAITSHLGRLNGICAFNSNSTFLAAACFGGNIHIVNISSGMWLSVLKGHSADVTTLHISTNDQWLVSGSKDRTVQAWPLKNLQQPSAISSRKLVSHRADISAICTLPTEPLQIVSASLDKSIRIWDAISGKLIAILDGPANEHCTKLLTINSTYFAAAYFSTIWIWNTTNFKPIAALPLWWCKGLGVTEHGTLRTLSLNEIQTWPITAGGTVSSTARATAK